LEEKVRKHPAFPLITYYGNLDRQGVSDLLKKSLIGMVTLLPTPNHLESQPIKMYEYMAAGIPVIASDFPYWKEIISRCGCGITVNPADPESIKKAVIALLENETWAASMGQKGREAIEKEFNWEVEEKRLIAFYTQIIDGRRN
jgi:glycosyltransferase involved in cell wall biosynthesis